MPMLQPIEGKRIGIFTMGPSLCTIGPCNIAPICTLQIVGSGLRPWRATCLSADEPTGNRRSRTTTAKKTMRVMKSFPPQRHPSTRQRAAQLGGAISIGEEGLCNERKRRRELRDHARSRPDAEAHHFGLVTLCKVKWPAVKSLCAIATPPTNSDRPTGGRLGLATPFARF